MNDSMQAVCSQAIHDVMEQREEILRTFVAKYGFEANRAVQIVQHTPTGSRWFVKRFTDEEMEEASRLGSAL